MHLLSWHTRLAPFIGQRAEKDALLEWARDRDSAIRIRFLTGPGGAGKTRLAAEVADELNGPAQAGSRLKAGFVQAGPGEIELPPRGPALVIMDYPEERRGLTRDVFEKFMHHRTARLLLLTRRPLESWRSIIEELNLRLLVAEHEIAVPRLTPYEAAELYAEVCAKMARVYSLRVPEFNASDFLAWVESDPSLHELPLFITAAGIHGTLQPQDRFGFSGKRIVKELAAREIDRLGRASRGAGLEPRAAPIVAALAVARRGIDESCLVRLAEPSLHIGLPPPDAVIDGVRHLEWWNGRRWPAATPHIVAAALLFEVLNEHSAAVPEWLFAVLQGTDSGIIDRLGRLFYDMSTLYDVEHHTFSEWLVQMIRDRPERADAFKFLTDRRWLPLGLQAFAVEVDRGLLTGKLSDVERARLLNALAFDLQQIGDRGGAREASQQAVTTFRRLAGDDQKLEAELAKSLRNLAANSLHIDPDQAFAAIVESVEIRRKLAHSGDPAIQASYAESLRVLSTLLVRRGDREQALDAIKTACSLLEPLARVDATEYGQQLANVLETWSDHVHGDDPDDALVKSWRAVTILEDLAARSPTRFEDNLASSLVKLSSRLGLVDDTAGSLKQIERAVAIFRRLAGPHVPGYEIDLADALMQLSDAHAASAPAKSLSAVEDAVTIYNDLARKGSRINVKRESALRALAAARRLAGDPAGADAAEEEAAHLDVREWDIEPEQLTLLSIPYSLRQM